MAVVVNTAQGIGQPIRGTCLTSLGSTGIVAAFWNGSAVEHNTLIVPEFGTSVELTVYSTLANPPVTLARAWGEAPQEIANPLRNWPPRHQPSPRHRRQVVGPDRRHHARQLRTGSRILDGSRLAGLEDRHPGMCPDHA